ncbi:restriction endonuclease subunit S [Phormidium tenue]|uniref:Restriction endonuclease subunit S n=1 Tax=Phormidium tenue FACHB-1050 TaxID=2692857 RepID=A0ABR8C7F9_9CYAN|nr:restriction endonuclease subunit S [Phormidium tenue]MBD2316183.1 restriction endonuclease subunit S [Phormidium tenue FACHB-1050]
MIWAKTKLGEVLTLKRGYDLPESKRESGSIPVVSSSGITGYHNASKAKAPGVVTGRYGTLSEIYFIEEDFWPHNTALYVQDFKGNHQRFIAYFLKYILFKTSSDKAAVPGVNRNDLHAREIFFPSQIETQIRIASVLSAYDELIENNRRRIQLLERSLHLLYKEWFVHLRFPSHEHSKIVDGIPEGWEKVTAFDVMEILNGGTPKTAIADYWDGIIPFFTPKDAASEMYTYETEKFVTEYGLKNCNSKLYPKDTIFITARGTVGKISLAQREMAMNQSCFALVAKEPLNQYFLYFALQERVSQFRSRAVGAVFDSIIRETFKFIPFIVPHPLLIGTFTDYITPIVRQIDNLLIQNRKLKQARDLLLPKLMSGAISV